MSENKIPAVTECTRCGLKNIPMYSEPEPILLTQGTALCIFCLAAAIDFVTGWSVEAAVRQWHSMKVLSAHNRAEHRAQVRRSIAAETSSSDNA